MKCERVRAFTSPYLDSELDPATTYEISRHLESCRSCAERLAAEVELERALARYLGRPSGDEERVLRRVLDRTLGRGSSRRRRGLRVAAALLLAGGAAALVRWRAGARAVRPEVPELVAMAARDHREFLDGEIAPTLLTSDALELEAFLRDSTDAASCALPSGNGWQLEGARVCSFHGRTLGLVTLRYRGTPVSVVDAPLPDGGIPSAAGSFELPGGRGALRRTPCGLRAAFGNVPAAALDEVLQSASEPLPTRERSDR